MTTVETPLLVRTRIHMTSITISTSGQVSHLAVGGRMVRGAESEGLAMEAFARCFRRDTRLIVVDLGGLQKMDAAGLGFLAFAYNEARRNDTQFVVENPPRFVQELFHIAGLDRFFGTANDETNAR